MVQRLHDFILGTVTEINPWPNKRTQFPNLHRAWDLGVPMRLSEGSRKAGLGSMRQSSGSSFPCPFLVAVTAHPICARPLTAPAIL